MPDTQKLLSAKHLECIREQLTKNLSHEFTMKVDWDLDFFGAEGCHGTDTFFQDDPIELKFRKITDGSYVITGFDVPFILRPDGKLHWIKTTYQCTDLPAKSCGLVEEVMETPRFPVKRVTHSGKSAENMTTYAYVGYSANHAFLACYDQSLSMNPDAFLNRPRQTVIQFFFDAVEAMFPNLYYSIDKGEKKK